MAERGCPRTALYVRRLHRATQPVLYANGVVPQLDTVQIDSAFGGRFLDAEVELKRYRALLDTAERASLGTEDSRNLIHHIAREL